MERLAFCIIAEIVGLQYFIDHATFRNIQGEKSIFGKTGVFDQLVLFDPECVNRVVLTEGALVDPAVWKDKIVFRHSASAFKFFKWLQEYLGVDGRYSF